MYASSTQPVPMRRPRTETARGANAKGSLARLRLAQQQPDVVRNRLGARIRVRHQAQAAPRVDQENRDGMVLAGLHLEFIRGARDLSVTPEKATLSFQGNMIDLWVAG